MFTYINVLRKQQPDKWSATTILGRTFLTGEAPLERSGTFLGSWSKEKTGYVETVKVA